MKVAHSGNEKRKEHKDEVKRKLDVLREHCAKPGRPYEQIEKTSLDTISLTRDGRDGTLSPAAAIDYFGEVAAQGFDQAIFNTPRVADLETFEVLAQIMPEVEKIAVAGR